jgi:hypothetical protein
MFIGVWGNNSTVWRYPGCGMTSSALKSTACTVVRVEEQQGQYGNMEERGMIAGRGKSEARRYNSAHHYYLVNKEYSLPVELHSHMPDSIVHSLSPGPPSYNSCITVATMQLRRGVCRGVVPCMLMSHASGKLIHVHCNGAVSHILNQYMSTPIHESIHNTGTHWHIHTGAY